MNRPELAAIFQDIYPHGMVGFTDDAAVKFVAEAFSAAKRKHPTDKQKAAFMAVNIVKTHKKSIVCNLYTEAA